MLLETLLQDIRIGARGLLKDKGFSVLAIVVLALGICGVTTQFTVVNAVVWKGFSFPNADQLVDVQLVDPVQVALGNNFGGMADQDYEEVFGQQQSYSASAPYINGSTVNVTVDGHAQRYTGAYVGHQFFKILGVAPVIGRDFTAEDDRQGAERVTLIGDSIWRRDFGARPDIVGRTIRMNGRVATIIGVMPPNFQFPVSEQLWIPLRNEFPSLPRGDPRAINLNPAVVARLKPAVSLELANTELTGIAKRLAIEFPASNRLLTAGQVRPLIANFIGAQIKQILYAMLAAVAMVLLIACVNVMNMQFARATLRAKELAVRSALGATRSRLIRQMLTESLVLATIGGVIGVFTAYFAVDLLFRATQALPFPLPYWISFAIDERVLAITVGIAMTSAVVSGLLPAILASRASNVDVLKEGGRGNTSRFVNRVSAGLVVGQIAITCALLIASILQIKSIHNQQSMNYGYDQTSVYSGRIGLFEGDYPTPESRLAFFERVTRELKMNPAFESVALTSSFRMTFNNFVRYEIEGQKYADDNDRPQGSVEGVSEGYFTTLGLKVLEGRDFNLQDRDEKLPVAIVNTKFARKHFGHESPIGRRIRVYNPANALAWRTIIGVAPDTFMQGPFNTQTDGSGFFTPISAPPTPQFATVIVRPHAGVKADLLDGPLRSEISRIDPNLPMYFGGTPATLHDEILGQNRIVATLFSMFGGVAVILSAVGLYGVMSFSVNQRLQEFGIRMALGADARNILRMVLRQGSVQLAIGTLIGLAAAYALVLIGGANLQNFLFEVNPRDPVIYGSVVLLLALVTLASCLVPARRATRVDPMIALRAE